MKYSNKAIFLMAKLRAALHKHDSIDISLQDPDVANKLISKGYQSGTVMVKKLALQLENEMNIHARRQAYAQQKDTETTTIAPQVTDKYVHQDSALYAFQQNLEALLSEYCGPISNFLVARAIKQSEHQHLDQDFQQIAYCLAEEIADLEDRNEFLDRIDQLHSRAS